MRELILSVDAEQPTVAGQRERQYAGSPLYQELLNVKPEYGSNRCIGVKLIDGKIVVTNVHVGSLGDIITYPIDIDPELKVSKVQLLDAILKEIASDGFSDSEQSDFWTEMTNLQRAKIIR